jgi:hypothetical protein
MTLPDSPVELTLVPAGRHLSFAKEVLHVADVHRRIGDEAAPWELVAHNARSPYLDQDVLPVGTVVFYQVRHQTQQGTETARSHIVQTTIT